MSRVLRFLLSGGLTTAASWLTYLLLLQVLPYRWSYSIAYVLGVVLAYLLYRHFVFRRNGGARAVAALLAAYLLQYLLGLLLVTLWVQALGAPAVWAPLFAVVVSLPFTYAINRWGFAPS